MASEERAREYWLLNSARESVPEMMAKFADAEVKAAREEWAKLSLQLRCAIAVLPIDRTQEGWKESSEAVLNIIKEMQNLERSKEVENEPQRNKTL